jgi:alpha-glucosidase
MWVRSGIAGRDGCRTPMPWTPEAPGFGFTTGEPWLPFDPEADVRNVEKESANEESPLSLYRTALQLRRLLRGSLGTDVTLPDAPPGCVVVSRTFGADQRIHVLMNLAAETATWEVPDPEAQLLLRSQTGARLADGILTVPGECTVWIGPAT